jgi:hypothetical protein
LKGRGICSFYTQNSDMPRCPDTTVGRRQPLGADTTVGYQYLGWALSGYLYLRCYLLPAYCYFPSSLPPFYHSTSLQLLFYLLISYFSSATLFYTILLYYAIVYSSAILQFYSATLLYCPTVSYALIQFHTPLSILIRPYTVSLFAYSRPIIT